MNSRRLNITRAGALKAALWFAACPASWLVWRLEGPNEHWLLPFALPLGFLMCCGPIVGLGTLVGRPKHGLLLGMLVFFGLLVWMLWGE